MGAHRDSMSRVHVAECDSCSRRQWWICLVDESEYRFVVVLIGHCANWVEDVN